MGTKNNPGQFDCYEHAEPDEPMFVLLGRDKHAPTLVWLWATLRELDGEDMAKVKEARDCVFEMMKFAKARGRPAVGLGQSALCGVMELIRAINSLMEEEDTHNTGTTDDIFRRYMAQCHFDPAAADAEVHRG
jgi:hypothetical protein